MSAIPISTSVATFLGKYQERMASCKVNHLKRSVGDLCVAIKSVLEEGRGFEAAGIKHLRDMSRKVAEVRLLQGVVERPKARREVIGFIEVAVKACNKFGM